MQRLLKYAVLIFWVVYIANNSVAQTTTTPSSSTSTATKKKPAKKLPTTVLGKQVSLTINNLAEKPVPVYIGPKEGLRKPKVTTLGGKSKNAMTLRVNEVVCILSSDGKKAIACKDVKVTTTVMEISSSGTVISSK